MTTTGNGRADDGGLDDDGADSEPGGLVTVGRFTSPVEAEFAVGRLQSAGIECILPEEQMSLMYSFGLTGMGGIRLQVRAQDEEDAKAILADPGI